MKFKIKNFEKYQHYKNRRPPWIKVHREVFDDRKFMSLSLADRGLLIQLWLIASENSEDYGVIDMSDEDLAWRLRVNKVNLEPLITSGFIIVDSKCLQGVQNGTQSQRGGESESEGKNKLFFDEFWAAYPSRNGKKLLKSDARRFLKRNVREQDFGLLLTATNNYANSRSAKDGYAKDAVRWLKNWREWLEPESKPNKGNNKDCPCYNFGSSGVSDEALKKHGCPVCLENLKLREQQRKEQK